MYLAWFDWAIILGLLGFMCVVAFISSRHNKSVADFMAANRCAGRYVLGIAEGVAAMAAINIIGSFEGSYQAGFSSAWWGWMTMPVAYAMGLSGWIIYRYRETRAMTMGQFFEIRYSRNFRVFTGILAFISGIINFGIFPAVGARFFIYFCDIPTELMVSGFDIPSYPLITLALVGIALYFTFSGGQITVIITDFFQGMFCNIVFVIVLLFLLVKFSWPTIVEGLEMAPKGHSKLNPFDAGDLPTFSPVYFLIFAFQSFYGHKAWQGAQGYNCSAKSAHEAKMAGIMGTWRAMAQGMLFMLLPICAFVVMNHYNYSGIAENVKTTIGTIEDNYIREQMTVSVAIRYILPKGLLGAFCAIMLAAFITTNDTYLHSWGTIFVQDVILPFRKKPFTPKQHLLLLRLSIIGVAIFIYMWALLFKQNTYIWLYFMITGAIYLGGAGAVIIGGLYWKRGTTAAAWCAMTTGAVLSVGSIILKRVLPGEFAFGDSVMFHGFLNKVLLIVQGKSEHIVLFWCIIICVFVYVIISLSGRKKFNMKQMLHRGRYAIKEDIVDAGGKPVRGLAALGITREFTRGDKIIYFSVMGYAAVLFTIFLVGTIYNITHKVSSGSWAVFWKYYVYLSAIIGIATTIWFIVGGFFDMKDMFRRLKSMKRNDYDDGTVVGHQNLADLHKSDN